MANLTLAYKARAYSTGTLGRAICNARTHHFVADDAGWALGSSSSPA